MLESRKDMTQYSFMQMSTKQTAAIVAIISGISIILFVQQMTFDDNRVPEPKPWKMKMKSQDFFRNGSYKKETAMEENSVPEKCLTNNTVVSEIWQQEQCRRIKYFRGKCQKYKLQGNYNISSWVYVYYSKKYKLAFRPIPKIGSTFMSQVMSLLTNTSNEQIFMEARSVVHNMKLNLKRKFAFERFLDFTVLIIVRNPYSRIYSAYIDKVYIVSSLPLCMDINSKLFNRNNNTLLCKFDISFEEFLTYLFHTDKPVLGDHYEPIMTLSYGKQMCNHQNIQIVKQETFSEDVDHALKSVHVNGPVYDVIYDEMNSKHTESTIGSIVKTVHRKFYSNVQRNSCLSWKDMAVKLWKSFQIQGYIHESSKFPETKFTNDTDYESSNLIRVMLQEIQSRPLKYSEMVEQRNKALLNAYNSVDKKYIRQIRERYAMDFDMFHYSTDVEISVT